MQEKQRLNFRGRREEIVSAQERAFSEVPDLSPSRQDTEAQPGSVAFSRSHQFFLPWEGSVDYEKMETCDLRPPEADLDPLNLSLRQLQTGSPEKSEKQNFRRGKTFPTERELQEAEEQQKMLCTKKKMMLAINGFRQGNCCCMYAVTP